MTLDARDLEILQQAMLELHEERDTAAFRDAVPAILRRAIPADYFLWMEGGVSRLTHADDGTHAALDVVRWEKPRRFTAERTERLLSLLDEHPFTEHARRTGDWGPLRLSDFWTDAQLKRSALWRDVYRHVGIGRLLAAAAFRGDRVGTLNFGRAPGARDFSERDRTMMKLLLPHFVQGLQAAERESRLASGQADSLPTLGLTKREVQVAALLARGRSNDEIGRILAMQRRTVEKHVERILTKLGVENRTAAAVVVGGRLGQDGPVTPPASVRRVRR
ncbi:MAG: hypothetical protein HZA61_06925 [Candidatus Eisenbacteria bacterium]|uniref:HTH luxR-type domain-containing protein n=1 Tax=Eiseniibacteriota bacterium TaxID=2212470 RepID=A0A933SBD5_UNCEI|nr:hypothetical protein [Candidatus Eisenbacteria bacterium]